MIDPELVTCIQDNLARYGYRERHEVSIPALAASGPAERDEQGYRDRQKAHPDDVVATIVSTPRRLTVRYLCALVEAPPMAPRLEDALAFHERLRTGIRRSFAKFPWWKEIGTYAIVVCDGALFEIVKAHKRGFRDRTGFHMNVMLGTCFIDRETRASTADATWGLYYSGKHFDAMRSAVAQWREVVSERAA